MSGIGEISSGQRPTIPAWLKTRVKIPRPRPDNRSTIGLRHNVGPCDIRSARLNFQTIMRDPLLEESFVTGLLRIEERFGTATALAFGAVMGLEAQPQDQLFTFGDNLDLLWAQIGSGLKNTATARAKLLLMERRRKQLGTWHYSGVKAGLASVVSSYLSGGKKAIKGDCVDMAVLNAYLFLRAGIPAGIQTNFEHADALVQLDGELYLYKSAEVAQTNTKDRLVAYEPHPVRLPRNFLGVIAQITVDRANFYRELALDRTEAPNQLLLEKAHTLYIRARAVDATHPEIYSGLGQIAMVRGEVEKALILLATAIELGTEDPGVFRLYKAILKASRRD